MSRLYIMAISPRYWSMRNMNHHQITCPTFLPITCPSLLAQYHEGFDHYKSSSSSSILSLNSTFTNDDDFEQLPHSWSQLLVDEDKFGFSHHYHTSKKEENWENQIIRNQPVIRGVPNNIGDHIKQENSQSGQLFGSTQGGFDDDQEIISNNKKNTCNESFNWSHQQEVMQVSPSRKSLGRNSFDFSSSKTLDWRTQAPEHSTECNSTSTGGVSKKAKVQSSPTQPPLKIRKEKLGERITNLHQVVSPYGKTDTASVLLETIGTIRYLQGQIEALSSPYLSNTSTNMRPKQNGDQDELKDLKSRGLCLVPVSCINHIGDDNGADYWGPAPGGAF